MAARQVLIIHGWSDTSKSFRALAKFLADNGYAAKELWLGDYISLDDDVRVTDVGRRMAEVIDDMMASKQIDSTFDVVVHSTGGLVAREWLTTRYKGKAETCPMKRLVMLAPANYGSKLAATGKSFLGRVVKGYNNWFHTGQSMLNDLELSSPYQWDLAGRDIFDPAAAQGATVTRYYGEDRVWPFVIVGTHPYASLLRQIANENGADGTVRVCAANLTAHGATIDFTQPEATRTPWVSRLDLDIPLAVLPTRTHGTIIDPNRANADSRDSIVETPEEKAQLGQLILQALACDSFASYAQIQTSWDKLITEATADRRDPPGSDHKPDISHQYLQVNVEVVDSDGLPVPDYFLEFYADINKKNTDANVYLHSKVIEDIKVNSQSSALRNLYFDRTDLVDNYYSMLPPETEPVLYLSISAAAPGSNVSYFDSKQTKAEGKVPVHLKEGDPIGRLLKRNSTHFVKIIIPRKPIDKVFRLSPYSDS